MQLSRYPDNIRKAIYTTNAIESLNSVIVKAVKKRKLFPSDDLARKVVYLATMDASTKRTGSADIRSWMSVSASLAAVVMVVQLSTGPSGPC